MPGGAHWAWNHLPISPWSIYPEDPFGKGQLEGSITKAWPLYFLTAPRLKMQEIQLDSSTRQEFDKRPNTYMPSGTNGYGAYGNGSAVAAYGWHPTLGYNGIYVGGSYSHGAFRGQGPGGTWGNPAPAGNPVQVGGSFYVRNASDVRQPSNLIQLGSARGGDISQSSGWHGYGQTNPDSGVIRPGYFLIHSPARDPNGRWVGNPVPGQFPTTEATTWDASNQYDEKRPPSTWGNLAMRCNGKAVIANFDASVTMLGLGDLRDMRKWCNVATRPDWTWPANYMGVTWQ